MSHRTPVPGRAMQQAIRGVVVAAALSAGMSALAGAQSSPQSGHVPQQGSAAANRVAAAQLGGLELTAEQRTRIETITAKYADASRAAMEGMATDQADGLKKLMALREKMLPEFRAVLTAAQREIFDRNMAEMKARLSPRP